MKVEKFHAPAPVLSNEDIARCRELAMGHRAAVHEIVVSVAAETGVSARDILGKRRGQLVAHVRQLVMHIAYEQGISMEAIGRALNRDHSTVSYGIKAERKRRNAGLQWGGENG